MMTMEYYTYTNGFKFGYKGTITTKDIVNIINCLHDLFPDEYKFSPEPITEGGILFEEFLGKTQRMYKTFRFHITNGYWPIINTETLNM